MNIQYFDPLSRAFGRMKKALFNPLDPKKWFVVGFTAFLSGLSDCRGGSGSQGRRGGRVDWEDVLYFPQTAWSWLEDHPVWAIVIAVAMVFLMILIVLVTWWSSRGKFTFLDNVVHDRARVLAPWHEYRGEGNSLFLWALGIGIIFMGAIVWYLIACVTALQGLYETSVEMSALIFPAITMGAGLLGIILLSGFVDLILYDFVVPIMYRDRSRTLKALQKFLPLFFSNLLYFLGYALFTLFATLLVIFVVIMAGFATCCVGFVVLAIPYVNAVILLPVSYTFRAFSVEFLEQFGSDFHVFPRGEDRSAGSGPSVQQV